MESLVPALLASSTLLILWWWKLHKKENTIRLPPGPPAYPIIGHIRHIPASRPELTYMQWGKEYNTDILYLNLLGQPAIILNSVRAAIDLLDRRGAKYSDRPTSSFFEEQGWRETVAFYSTGSQFRKHRKMFKNAFSPANCVPYREPQQREARNFVKNIISTTENWESHLRTSVTTVILNIAYGITIKSKDDPYVKLADMTSYALGNGGSAGTTMVDVFPLIRNLPHWVTFIPSLKFARDCYPYIRKMHELPFAGVKQEMVDEVAKPSFTRQMLEEKRRKEKKELSGTIDDVTDADIMGAAGGIYAAGQDTTWSTITIFVLCMTLHPEVQQKAWEELDSVLGPDRLPTFADREKLPYIENIVQETFRWNPVVPLTIPHKLSEDDIYREYFIPKGSLVIANPYAMGHDKSIYSDPDNFFPDRYLSKEQGGLGEPLPVGHFGFGRRICPGRYLGSAGVWMIVATMLATLKISKSIDADGNEIPPCPEMTTGLVSHPKPFPCSLKPRSPHISDLLARV